MNKKRFDHIEQDIKAAAEGWEPPFDEGAWEQMEKMLEGENDRKRPVAWWMWLLPLLLVTGTGAYFMFKNDDPGKTPTVTAQNIPANNESAGKVTKESTTSPRENKNNNHNTTTTPVTDVFSKQPVIDNGKARVRVWSAATTTTGNANDDITGTKRINDQQKGRMKMAVNGGMVSDEEEKINTDEPTAELTNENKQPVQPVQNDVIKTPDPVAAKKTTETKQEEPVTQKQNDKKEKVQKPSRFYFSLLAGMEGNGVDFPGLNKVSPRAGFTVGYQLTKNLSVQTGFFAGSKKYVAGKYDYKAKPGSYWSTVDITKVDADCRVFEIPIALRWDFNPSAKWNAFAGAGLSSYIMDKEDYMYEYIRYNNPYQAQASYTGNQHFLSVLRITGGVERKVSKQFSVGVNPGLAIPLAGVGEGQIKLFSTELLLSLKYRPFKK